MSWTKPLVVNRSCAADRPRCVLRSNWSLIAAFRFAVQCCAHGCVHRCGQGSMHRLKVVVRVGRVWNTFCMPLVGGEGRAFVFGMSVGFVGLLRAVCFACWPPQAIAHGAFRGMGTPRSWADTHCGVKTILVYRSMTHTVGVAVAGVSVLEFGDGKVEE